MNIQGLLSGYAFTGFNPERQVPVKRFVIAASSSGINAVVAAVTGRRIRVLSYNYVVDGAVNAAWRSGATTVIGGVGYWDAKGRGKVVPRNVDGWFETAAGEALNLHLSGAVAVGGEGTYIEVPE